MKQRERSTSIPEQFRRWTWEHRCSCWWRQPLPSGSRPSTNGQEAAQASGNLRIGQLLLICDCCGACEPLKSACSVRSNALTKRSQHAHSMHRAHESPPRLSPSPNCCLVQEPVCDTPLLETLVRTAAVPSQRSRQVAEGHVLSCAVSNAWH